MKKAILLLLILLCMFASPACAETALSSLFSEPVQEPVVTETSYLSGNMAIEITSLRAWDCDVYVADIHVRSAEQLQRAFAGGKWNGGTRKIAEIATENNAILAITGDSAQNFVSGWVVANGEIQRDKLNRKRDLFVIWRDGSAQGFHGGEVTQEELEAQADSMWQAFLFGPILLDEDGVAYMDFSESNVTNHNPRAAIGYYEPGHYCFVQVDGRDTKSALEQGARSQGMTLEELALFMEELGCSAAYNLDGGRSAALWFNGKVISTQADSGRRIGDIVLLRE